MERLKRKSRGLGLLNEGRAEEVNASKMIAALDRKTRAGGMASLDSEDS